MTFAYFVFFQHRSNAAAVLADSDRHGIAAMVLRTPGLQKMHLFTPEPDCAFNPAEGPAPLLGLQLYFQDLAQLEAAIGAHGHLQALAAPIWPSLAGTHVQHQAMVCRTVAVPDPVFQVPADALPCSHLIHYPGAAEDFNAWLAYYLGHHVPIMTQFPGIREIEIYTRVDWCDAMPWRRVHHMQRNKIVFDSAAAAALSLDSPVRQLMRADFQQFPPFTGRNISYPMATLTQTPRNVSSSL